MGIKRREGTDFNPITSQVTQLLACGSQPIDVYGRQRRHGASLLTATSELRAERHRKQPRQRHLATPARSITGVGGSIPNPLSFMNSLSSAAAGSLVGPACPFRSQLEETPVPKGPLRVPVGAPIRVACSSCSTKQTFEDAEHAAVLDLVQTTVNPSVRDERAAPGGGAVAKPTVIWPPLSVSSS